MADILDDLRAVAAIQGATYSSYEVLGMVLRSAEEIWRLRANVAALTEERIRWRTDNEWLTKDNDRLRRVLKDGAIPFNYKGP